MSTTVAINVRIPSEGMTLNAYELESLGAELYRVVRVPSVLEGEYFGYLDILELRLAPDAVYELVEIKERGGWRRFDFLISGEFAESENLAAILTSVRNESAILVRDFGGCRGILLPPDSHWDPSDEIVTAYEASAGASSA